MDNLPIQNNNTPGPSSAPAPPAASGAFQTPPGDSQMPPATPLPSGSIGISKEAESLPGPVQPEGLTEVGKEQELPKEVAAVGVKLSPTVVPIPPPISAAGVQPSGPNVTLGSGASVSLPLTDDQIAKGLRQSVVYSWRWLAEWCTRKLKQLHIVLKTIGGKTVEVKQT